MSAMSIINPDWLSTVDSALVESDVESLATLWCNHAIGHTDRQFRLLSRVKDVPSKVLLSSQMRAYLALLLREVGWDYEEALEPVRRRLGFEVNSTPDAVERYAQAVCAEASPPGCEPISCVVTVSAAPGRTPAMASSVGSCSSHSAGAGSGWPSSS